MMREGAEESSKTVMAKFFPTHCRIISLQSHRNTTHKQDCQTVVSVVRDDNTHTTAADPAQHPQWRHLYSVKPLYLDVMALESSSVPSIILRCPVRDPPYTGLEGFVLLRPRTRTAKSSKFYLLTFPIFVFYNRECRPRK